MDALGMDKFNEQGMAPMLIMWKALKIGKFNN